MADRRLCLFLFPSVSGLVFAFAQEIVNLRLPAPANDPVNRVASAHGAFLACPEALAQSLLQYLTGTVLGQIRL